MSTFDFFDKDDEQQVHANARPIWTIGDLQDPANDKRVLKWLNAEVNWLRQDGRDRTDEIRKHYQLYKGLSLERIARSDERDRLVDRNRIQRKVVINHLHDLTEQRVSRFVRFRPAVAILPTNDEWEDKQASKLAKRVLDHIDYVQRYDLKNQDVVRIKEIAGEGYLFIEWNPDIGEEHPTSLEVRDNGEKVPLIDSNGDIEKDELGNDIFIDKPVKVGDVEYRVVRPENIMEQKVREHKDADFFFEIKFDVVDNLKQQFPGSAPKIKSNKDQDFFDFSPGRDESSLPNRTIYFHFWHKKTPQLPQGAHIVFTPDVIMKNQKHPYTHGEFPFERMDAIQVPGEQYSRSFYINGRQIAAQINNLSTMILRNQKLASSPKWMVPRGAVKLEQLHNDVGIVQYQGPVAPTVVQSNPTPAEVFGFRDAMKEDLQQISGVSGVSRGEPPPGIKAGVALQFLDEQENERFNSDVARYNEFQRRRALKTLSVVGDFYKNSDQRTIAIVGKNDEFVRTGFDVSKLSSSFDVRIQNSSALPQSKAARIQTLIDMRKEFGPGLVRDDIVVDLIDFGQSEKYFDEAAAAVRAAEFENEQQNEGKRIDAELWEYHIQHWTVHVTDIQKPGFRDLPKEVQENKKDHILTHEMHMQTISKKNPLFLQQLQVLPQFPLFFTPDVLAPQPEVTPQQAVAAEVSANAEAPAPITEPEGLAENPAVPNLEPIGEELNPNAPPVTPTAPI